MKHPDSTRPALANCGQCGGWSAPDARSCSYCGAVLARRICVHCLQLNADGSRFCSACGQAHQAAAASALLAGSCPRCAAPSRALDTSAGRLIDCERCGGQFVETAALGRLLLQAPGLLQPGVPTAAQMAAEERARGVRYLACPVCERSMNRRAFGQGSGVVVDVCSKHGVFFDRGELPVALQRARSAGAGRQALLALFPSPVGSAVGTGAAGAGLRSGPDRTRDGAAGGLLEGLLDGVLDAAIGWFDWR